MIGAVSACSPEDDRGAPFLLWEQPVGGAFAPTGPRLDLGAVDPDGSAPLRFALFNAGDAVAEVTAVGSSEPALFEVTVDAALPRALRPGSRLEVRVTPRPTSACAVEAGLLADAPGAPTLALTVRADLAEEGAPALEVAVLDDSGGSALVTDGAEIDLGARLPGDSALRTLLVSNPGECPVTVDAIALTPTPDFALPSHPGAVDLPPSGALAVPVLFTAGAEGGERQGLLTLSTSAGARALPLAARVGTPEIGFLVGSGTSLVRPGAVGLDFGAAEVGARVRRVVRVVNDGDAVVTITGVSADLALFEVGWGAGDGALALAPGEGWEVPVTFVPDSAGSRVATLSVRTGAGEVTLQLVGAGLAGDLSLSVEGASGGAYTSLDDEGRIDFGAVDPGEEVFRRVRAENVGDGALTVTAATTTNGFRAFLPTPVDLEPGAHREFLVRFRPVASVESYSGSLVVKSDRNTRSVALSGALTQVCAAATAAPAVEDGPCVPSETVLCLHEARFAVTAAHQTSACESGVARVVSADDGSGVFGFGDGGWDLVVNVVDACAATGTYGVTAAAASRDRVELRVVDTATGAVKTWFSPLGEPFQPLADAEAFDACVLPE